MNAGERWAIKEIERLCLCLNECCVRVLKRNPRILSKGNFHKMNVIRARFPHFNDSRCSRLPWDPCGCFQMGVQVDGRQKTVAMSDQRDYSNRMAERDLRVIFRSWRKNEKGDKQNIRCRLLDSVLFFTQSSASKFISLHYGWVGNIHVGTCGFWSGAQGLPFTLTNPLNAFNWSIQQLVYKHPNFPMVIFIPLHILLRATVFLCLEIPQKFGSMTNCKL